MPNVLSRRSNLAFALACLALLAIKLLFAFYPGDFPGKDQAAAFSWPVVLGVMLLGLGGLFAERSLRIPDSFESPSRERQAAMWAICAGLLYGCITVGMDLYHPGVRSPVAKADWPHLALPWSIPFYSFGAVLLEFMLRLGALCILVWFIHVAVLRRRVFGPVFWAVNLIVALYEIAPWMMQDAQRGAWGHAALDLAGPLYLSNVFEGWLLLRYGWFSPIVFRLAFYLVWHILYGGLAGPS